MGGKVKKKKEGSLLKRLIYTLPEAFKISFLFTLIISIILFLIFLVFNIERKNFKIIFFSILFSNFTIFFYLIFKNLEVKKEKYFKDWEFEYILGKKEAKEDKNGREENERKNIP